MGLLKQGDFVVVYDLDYGLARGIIVRDEVENSQIYVVVVKNGLINQNYYNRTSIMKIS